MDNVIDINTGEPVEEYIAPEEDLLNRRKEAIKQLPQYRGEVPSRNAIRDLAKQGVAKLGDVYWTSLDEKPFIVSELTKKTVTVVPLDENATISTGITVYDLNKGIVSKEPLFDWTNENAVNDLKILIFDYFNLCTGPKGDGFCGNTNYLLYGRTLHYFTLFKVNRKVEPINFNIDIDSFIETIKVAGDLISIDKAEGALEIWIRTAESKAELLYLFPFDDGIVSL